MLGKPGHSPNNIVEGGGGIFAQIRSRQKKPPQKIPDKKSRTCKQAGYATGFIVIFASGFFNAYT